jgi:hypothetical protein
MRSANSGMEHAPRPQVRPLSYSSLKAADVSNMSIAEGANADLR